MKCLKCGTENPEGAAFCSACGRKLKPPKPKKPAPAWLKPLLIGAGSGLAVALCVLLAVFLIAPAIVGDGEEKKTPSDMMNEVIGGALGNIGVGNGGGLGGDAEGDGKDIIRKYAISLGTLKLDSTVGGTLYDLDTEVFGDIKAEIWTSESSGGMFKSEVGDKSPVRVWYSDTDTVVSLLSKHNYGAPTPDFFSELGKSGISDMLDGSIISDAARLLGALASTSGGSDIADGYISLILDTFEECGVYTLNDALENEPDNLTIALELDSEGLAKLVDALSVKLATDDELWDIVSSVYPSIKDALVAIGLVGEDATADDLWFKVTGALDELSEELRASDAEHGLLLEVKATKADLSLITLDLMVIVSGDVRAKLIWDRAEGKFSAELKNGEGETTTFSFSSSVKDGNQRYKIVLRLPDAEGYREQIKDSLPVIFQGYFDGLFKDDTLTLNIVRNLESGEYELGGDIHGIISLSAEGRLEKNDVGQVFTLRRADIYLSLDGRFDLQRVTLKTDLKISIETPEGDMPTAPSYDTFDSLSEVKREMISDDLENFRQEYFAKRTEGDGESFLDKLLGAFGGTEGEN